MKNTWFRKPWTRVHKLYGEGYIRDPFAPQPGQKKKPKHTEIHPPLTEEELHVVEQRNISKGCRP